MRQVKLTKAEQEYINQHPDAIKTPEEKESQEEKCKCKEPQFAFTEHSLRTDGTYFNYCGKCRNFRDVPKPVRKPQ